MFYKLAIVALASFALFAGQVNGAALVADNDDACNGSNNYGEGHSCAFKSSSGTRQGCRWNSCGVLVCKT
uniref:Uncharacterized protein n=1 Tax=Schizophyllum commune (strain H4-8 / FGSC 9210) TaxID=578458 RepID=D8QDK1_SCHCM